MKTGEAMGAAWYYLQNNEPSSPITEAEATDLFAREVISDRTLVWTDGLSDWQPLQDTELKSLIALKSQQTPQAGPPANPLAGSLEPPTTTESAAANRLRTASAGLPLDLLQPLFKWTRLAIYTFMFSNLLLLLSSAMMWHFLWSAKNGRAMSPDYAGLVDGISSGTGIFYLFWLVGAILLFSRFVFVAMRNLYRADAPKVTITPGWAVGWDFIPIANFWKPLQAAKEIWQSSIDLKEGKPNTHRGFAYWWVFWIVGGFLGNVAFRMQMKAGIFGKELKNPDLFMNSLIVDSVSSIAMILSCIFLIPILREITDAQHQNLNMQP